MKANKDLEEKKNRVKNKLTSKHRRNSDSSMDKPTPKVLSFKITGDDLSPKEKEYAEFLPPYPAMGEYKQNANPKLKECNELHNKMSFSVSLSKNGSEYFVQDDE